VGSGEQRLIEAALPGQTSREHVRRVGQGLHPVEDARGRVGDEGEPRPRGPGGQRLGHQQPAPPAGEDQSQAPVEAGAATFLEKRGRLLLQLAPRDLAAEAQVRRGALDSVQVLGERERTPVVDADDLEDAVAADEALLHDGDEGLRGGRHATVEARELSSGQGALRCGRLAHDRGP